MPKTDIAASLRMNKGLGFLDDEVAYVDDEIMGMIHSIFPFQRDEKRPTRLGSLEICLMREQKEYANYLRKPGKKDPNYFCAVYKRHGKPKTLLVGAFHDDKFVIPDADRLVRNVLEQRRFFSFPRREFIPELISGYGFRRGLGVFTLAALAVATDVGLAVYSNELGVPHQCYLLDVFENMVSFYGQRQAVINSAVSTSAIPFLVSGLFESIYRRAAQAADRFRVRHIQEYSDERGFIYGKAAEEGIVKGYLRKNQQKFKDILARSYDLSNEVLSLIYAAKLTGDSNWFDRNLDETPAEKAKAERIASAAFEATQPHYARHTKQFLDKPRPS